MQLGFVFETDPDRIFGLSSERRTSAAHRPSRASSRRAQLPLPLADDPFLPRPQLVPSVRGQERVEATLRELIGPRVIVSLTANRSTMISYKRRRGVLYVRAHAIFADAPREVLRAMAAFVADGRPTPSESELIDRWIELHRDHVRRTDKPITLQPRGEFHDLSAMLDRLNLHYFEGAILAEITWSRAPRNRKRTSIRMGSYCDETGIIRIHPALDQDFVPDFFVESVIFHEMLHEHYGVDEREDGRRCVHPPELLAHERRYPQYFEARAWEKKNLPRLLRY